jgi:Ran GTPase-activating protein (RanGAP) involved in mRNA processing and transport
VKGMYQGMKSLTLNYAQITDYGVEILAETLALNKSVTKVDLSSNHITDQGMMNIG